MVGYKLSKNDWVTPFFVIFRSVREKLLVTVSFDHPVAIGKIGGIKIESAAGRQKKLPAAIEFREKLNFFTLRPPAQKRREISGWVQWVK